MTGLSIAVWINSWAGLGFSSLNLKHTISLLQSSLHLHFEKSNVDMS